MDAGLGDDLLADIRPTGQDVKEPSGKTGLGENPCQGHPAGDAATRTELLHWG